MRLEYRIEFLGYWHCGSGLSSGAEADSIVIRDAEGLPFVPGKTVKGLLRDAAHEMLPFDPEIREEVVHAVFGHQAGSTGGKDGTGKGSFRSHGGRCHFSNAELPALERMEVAGPLSSHLYDTIASTSMDANTGTASPQTLRTIEVCVPLALEGHIDCEGEEDLKVLVKCLSWVRSIGAHRNRGLGRCRITVKTASS